MEHNQEDYIFHHRHFFLLQGCWSENKHLNTKSLYMFYGFNWEWRLGGEVSVLVFIDVWTLQRDCASADDALRRNIPDLLHISCIY